MFLLTLTSFEPEKRPGRLLRWTFDLWSPLTFKLFDPKNGSSPKKSESSKKSDCMLFKRMFESLFSFTLMLLERPGEPPRLLTPIRELLLPFTFMSLDQRRRPFVIRTVEPLFLLALTLFDRGQPLDPVG